MNQILGEQMYSYHRGDLQNVTLLDYVVDNELQLQC